MTLPTQPSYTGHRFPPEVIGHAVWLYFRFPLSLRMVEELLAARGILVSHETVRQWASSSARASPIKSAGGCLVLATSGTSMRS
jgi:transposase-like protein